VFLCLSYFRLPEALPVLHGFHLPLMFGAAAIASFAWHSLLSRSIRVYWTTELWLMVLLFALAVIGAFFADNRGASQAAITSSYWKIVASCLTLAWLVRKPGDFNVVVGCILVSGMVVGCVAIFNYVNGIGLVEGNRVTVARQLQSPLGDPNDLALVLMFPFGLALAILRYKPSRLMMLLTSSTALITLTGILLTRSRGGLLGVAIVAAVIGARMFRSKTLVLTIGIAVAAALYLAMGIASRQSGGAEEIARHGIDESSFHRLLAWRAALAMAAENPLTGVGIGNFIETFYVYTPLPIGRAIVAHSSWFGMLGEMGYPGLITFVTMILFAMRSAASALRLLEAQSDAPPVLRGIALGCLTGIISFCVTASFITFHTGWPIYILVGLTGATLRYAEKLFAASAAEQADGVRGNR
jgi:O-antigen ligase